MTHKKEEMEDNMCYGKHVMPSNCNCRKVIPPFLPMTYCMCFASFFSELVAYKLVQIGHATNLRLHLFHLSYFLPTSLLYNLLQSSTISNM